MVGPRSPSLAPNHDAETTVFPRPQRETRERYALAIAKLTRPTDDDRHVLDCLRAVTRASRSMAPRVADPLPTSLRTTCETQKAATRDRPTEHHADRQLHCEVPECQVHGRAYRVDVHVRPPPRSPARLLAARVSPLTLPPRASPSATFATLLSAESFVSDRPPSFRLTEIIPPPASARAGTMTRS